MPFMGSTLESEHRYGSLTRTVETAILSITTASPNVVELGFHNCSQFTVVIPPTLNATQPLRVELFIRVATQNRKFADLSVPPGVPFTQSFSLAGQAVRAVLSPDAIDDGNNVQAQLILMGSA